MRQTYPHKKQVVESAVMGSCAAQAHKDNANERGEGEDIRREDTRCTAGFAHGG